MNKYSDFSGVILAGGRGSRLGFPKERLSFRDRNIIAMNLELFNSLFEEVLIITDNQKRLTGVSGVKIVKDLVKDCGPLGGIYTGLKKISRDKAFFVACDMPFLRIDLIERLLNISRKNIYNCIIPYSYKGIEPLHAIYHKRILSNLEKCLCKKNLSIKQLLSNCDCKYIRCHKGELISFFNINTADDLKEMKRIEMHEGKDNTNR